MIEKPISSSAQNILTRYFRRPTVSNSDWKSIYVAPNTASRPTKTPNPEDAAYQLRRHLIEIAAKIINCLFQCGKPKAQGLEEQELPRLTDFIHRLLRRTNLSNNNLLTALIYLIRLKQRHPGCKGAYGSGHRLFLAALVSANKYLHDDAYYNKSWTIAANGLFTLSEINQMESELLYYLNFKLVVTKEQWLDFLKLMEPKLLKSWAFQDYNGPSHYLFNSCTDNIDGPVGDGTYELTKASRYTDTEYNNSVENLNLALLGGDKGRHTDVPSLPPVWELLAQKNTRYP